MHNQQRLLRDVKTALAAGSCSVAAFSSVACSFNSTIRWTLMSMSLTPGVTSAAWTCAATTAHHQHNADGQADVIPTARELGIGIVPWGPLGAGFLTGRFTSRADFEPTDLRMQTYTKMSEQNFAKVLMAPENCQRCGRLNFMCS